MSEIMKILRQIEHIKNMNKSISDDTANQIWTIAESLKEHFRKNSHLQLVQSEIHLSPYDRELTVVPGNRNLLTFL